MVEINGIPIIRDPREAAAKLQNDPLIGFDTETTGLSPWRDQIATMQFYGEQSGTAAVIQLEGGVVPPEIKSLFNPAHTFVCHNAVGFDLLMLGNNGVPWENAKWYDTLIGETVCVSSGRKDIRKNLGATAQRRLGTVIDKTIEHGHWTEELSDRQIQYAISDVLSLPAIMRAQIEKANESGQYQALLLEQDIAPYVAKMTLNGLPCKAAVMRQFIHEQEAKRDEAEKLMISTFGDINFNSHVQIKKAVKQHYGLTWESTAESALLDMVYEDPVSGPLAQILLDYRAPAQRLKMYNEDFIEDHIINDWVHARFWQCSADTGRFTCSNPNLQQVPRDSRYIIGNMPGYTIVAVDYSQIEVRVAAYVSQDQELISAVDDADIHRAIASMLFKVPASEVTKEQRRKAKAAAFALLYCGGVNRLFNQARQDGSPITMEEAGEIFHSFFSRFKGLWDFRQMAIARAKRNPVNTIRMPSTLRRVLVGRDNRPSVILNNTVQGFAAAGIKQGIRIAGERGLMKYVGAQVHDELVAAVPDNEWEEYSVELQRAMLEGMALYLPINVVAEIKHGTTWK